MPDDNRRFLLVMDRSMQSALEELKPWTGCGNETALLHDAVAFYRMAVAKIREGKHVYIGDDPATAAEVRIIEVELVIALERAP